ncbi:aspartate/glutamate racemase family protein [Vibrio alfacsensis]|uniref:aspartate/glutamate racemase family protein n=1 Tax=Vibrio alfacsensis TaxID=1074311 RepID=UPI004068F967
MIGSNQQDVASFKYLPELGLLGLGSRTTQFYFEQLNRQYHAQFLGDSSCPLLLVNTNFNEFNPYLPNQYDKLQPALMHYLTILHSLNVKRVIIPNITLHESIDNLDLDDEIYPEIIHPVTETIRRLKADEQSEIMLIGSLYSMASNRLYQQFNDAGIVINVPNQQMMQRIDNIRKRVYGYCEDVQDSDEFFALIAGYQSQSAVVIACTELSILAQAKPTSIYDMVTIQLQTAINQIL